MAPAFIVFLQNLSLHLPFSCKDQSLRFLFPCFSIPRCPFCTAGVLSRICCTYGPLKSEVFSLTCSTGITVSAGWSWKLTPLQQQSQPVTDSTLLHRVTHAPPPTRTQSRGWDTAVRRLWSDRVLVRTAVHMHVLAKRPSHREEHLKKKIDTACCAAGTAASPAG